MNEQKNRLQEVIHRCVRHLPGVMVLTAVLLLLRGPSGTLDALKLQFATLVASFLGSGDGLGVVFVHTLPLAVASAAATFLIARGILRFESFASVVGLSIIIAFGASVGGFARGLISKPAPPLESVDYKTPLAPVRNQINGQTSGVTLNVGIVRPVQNGAETTRVKHTLSLPIRTESILVRPASRPTSAVDQLREIDWLAEPRFAKLPAGRVEPLNLLPETGGVLGLVARAANQMLGYLVAYQPRLFLAAVIAGSWMGWTAHRRLAELDGPANEFDEAVPESDRLRRAA